MCLALQWVLVLGTKLSFWLVAHDQVQSRLADYVQMQVREQLHWPAGWALTASHPVLVGPWTDRMWPASFLVEVGTRSARTHSNGDFMTTNVADLCCRARKLRQSMASTASSPSVTWQG